jgi:hypothetical protein
MRQRGLVDSVSGAAVCSATRLSRSLGWPSLIVSATEGGGIEAYPLNGAAPVVIDGCTIDSNYAYTKYGGEGVGGGGISAITSGSPQNLTIENSTISRNSITGYGGGISVYDGSFQMINSTLSGNRATFAGGISTWSEGTTMILTADTIVDNPGGPRDPAPIDTYASDLRFVSDLFGDNGGYPCASIGAFTQEDYNLATEPICLGRLRGAHDIIGVDAKLSLLAANGGPTQTIGLLPGSLAIDAGACRTGTDQRGYPRPQGAVCDIGAFELLRPPPPLPRPSNVPPADSPPAPIPRSNGSVGSAGPSPAPMPPSR